MTVSPLTPAGPFTYCIYVHPWPCDIKKEGYLRLSWSEGTMNGSIVVAKVRMRTVRDGDEVSVEAG